MRTAVSLYWRATLADCVRSTWIYRCSLGIVGPEAQAMVERKAA